MESPLINKSESAPRSRRPSAENTPSPTSSAAASNAGDADGCAAYDYHEAAADAPLASSNRFGHLAPRWFRSTKSPTPATIPTPALTVARTPSRTLNPLNPDTFATAAAQFAGEVAGTDVDAEAKHLAAAAIPFAEGTSGSADDLVRAADAFAAGKFRSVKIAHTDLVRMGQMLEHIARTAPDTEKELAEIAIALVGLSSILVLEEVDDTPPSRLPSTAKRVDLVSCLRCLQACFSTAPTTAKIADQRTFIFALTLSTTIALFTTMKVEAVMSANVAAWVGGGSAIAWLCVNGGSMMNLYGHSIFEQRAVQHLSRLGMMGLSLLFCLFMYAWFFPHLLGLFWALVVLAAALHGTMWLLSCLRHDDDSAIRLSDEDLCMCPRCKPSCTCCGNSGSGAHDVESV